MGRYVSLAKRFFGKQGRWAIAIDPSYISKAGKKKRKQSLRAVLRTLIKIIPLPRILNWGLNEYKRRRQVLCLNGSLVSNRVQEQEPS
jgi:hypothetical protein